MPSLLVTKAAAYCLWDSCYLCPCCVTIPSNVAAANRQSREASRVSGLHRKTVVIGSIRAQATDNHCINMPIDPFKLNRESIAHPPAMQTNMAAPKKTWFLAPTWDIPPSAIRLGHIICDPTDPRYPPNPVPAIAVSSPPVLADQPSTSTALTPASPILGGGWGWIRWGRFSVWAGSRWGRRGDGKGTGRGRKVRGR